MGRWSLPGEQRSVLSSVYFLGGTSMASPHVAGIVALMAEKNPALSMSEAETVLDWVSHSPSSRMSEPRTNQIDGLSESICMGR